MAEPRTRADRIDTLLPWLLHWSITDERLGGFRSDAYAVQTPDGLMVVDALPLEPHLEATLPEIAGILLTHGNHQRSAWRLRRESAAPVYIPVGANGLDEDPNVWFGPDTELPGGLIAIEATGFEAAKYLHFTHADGTGVLFCGDLICQDPGGPYRFPQQPGYFDAEAGVKDARRLFDRPATVLCPAHAAPIIDGCRATLRDAIGLHTAQAQPKDER